MCVGICAMMRMRCLHSLLAAGSDVVVYDWWCFSSFSRTILSCCSFLLLEIRWLGSWSSWGSALVWCNLPWFHSSIRATWQSLFMLSISRGNRSYCSSRVLSHKVFNNLRGIDIHTSCFLSTASTFTFLGSYCRLTRAFSRGWLIPLLDGISSKRRCNWHWLVTRRAEIVLIILRATTAVEVALMSLTCRFTTSHSIQLILVSRVNLRFHLPGLNDSWLLGCHILRKLASLGWIFATLIFLDGRLATHWLLYLSIKSWSIVDWIEWSMLLLEALLGGRAACGISWFPYVSLRGAITCVRIYMPSNGVVSTWWIRITRVRALHISWLRLLWGAKC